MKKTIYLIAILLLTGLLSGCGKAEKEPNIESNTEINTQPNTESNPESNAEQSTESTTENEDYQPEDITDSGNSEENDIALEAITEIDYGYDYTEDIKADVNYVVSESSSLQEELKNIDKIIEKYNVLAYSATAQMEMNMASKWFYVIWDTELNNLWSRFSDLADQDTKEKVLEEQRNWIAMKEEVTLMSLGTHEENGSMYPLLVNSLWEEKTKNRAYVIANELAKLEGEPFTMPETSTKYGLFVDNQRTGSVYSSLITRQGWEGADEAIISIYRTGGLEGTFIDNGNGKLDFTSYDGNIKGIIQINGWDGATFEITETMGEGIFSVGETFEFPFVF
mgnify:CR=1 FL=1